MKDFINIGSSPIEEECAQVGSENYLERARQECQRYIATIRRVCGKEPEGARLAVIAFPHDFGTYYEVVCHYDDSCPESFDYALWIEGNGPVVWGEGVNQRKWVPKKLREQTQGR